MSPIRSDPIRSDLIPSDPGFVSPIRSDPIRSDPVRSGPIRSDPVRSWFCQRPLDNVVYVDVLFNGQYKTRTADCGLRTGLGIKHGLSIKCGLSLKIVVLTHKSQKMLLFQFSPALLSWVSFIYSISFSNLKYGFENSENYFQISNNKEL